MQICKKLTEMLAKAIKTTRKCPKEKASISENILLPTLFSSLKFFVPYAHIWSFLFWFSFSFVIFPWPWHFVRICKWSSPARMRTPCPLWRLDLRMGKPLTAVPGSGQLPTMKCFKDQRRGDSPWRNSTSVDLSPWVWALHKLTSK